MNKVLYIIFISLFSLTIISCAKKSSTSSSSTTTSGAVTTLAGTGSSGSANGTGTSASFYSPSGITTDGTNLYVVDGNHLIRQIVISTGAVTTLAGTGSTGSANGTGTSASFSSPREIIRRKSPNYNCAIGISSIT